MSDAINQINGAQRFSLYWIALEILAGPGDAIRITLAKAYGAKKKAFADDQLRFEELAQMRNDLMHHGHFSSFADWQERLMQLLFWDIVIHQMNLPHRGLARALVKSGLIEQEMQDSRNPSLPDAAPLSTEPSSTAQ